MHCKYLAKLKRVNALFSAFVWLAHFCFLHRKIQIFNTVVVDKLHFIHKNGFHSNLQEKGIVEFTGMQHSLHKNIHEWVWKISFVANASLMRYDQLIFINFCCSLLEIEIFDFLLIHSAFFQFFVFNAIFHITLRLYSYCGTILLDLLNISTMNFEEFFYLLEIRTLNQFKHSCQRGIPVKNYIIRVKEHFVPYILIISIKTKHSPDISKDNKIEPE